MWNPISRGFNALLLFLKTIWETWKQTLKIMWDFALAQWTWLVGIFWTFIFAAFTYISWVVEQIAWLMNAFASMVMPSSDAQREVGDLLQKANCIIPVTEGFTILAALCVLWLIAVAYRFVKSWIIAVGA